MNAPAAPDPLKCPVCTSRFRGNPTCPRCGTDLSALMHIAARAWLLRQQAGDAMRAGDLSVGLRLFTEAKRLRRV